MELSETNFHPLTYQYRESFSIHLNFDINKSDRFHILPQIHYTLLKQTIQKKTVNHVEIAV